MCVFVLLERWGGWDAHARAWLESLDSSPTALRIGRRILNERGLDKGEGRGYFFRNFELFGWFFCLHRLSSTNLKFIWHTMSIFDRQRVCVMHCNQEDQCPFLQQRFDRIVHWFIPFSYTAKKFKAVCDYQENEINIFYPFLFYMYMYSTCKEGLFPLSISTPTPEIKSYRSYTVMFTSSSLKFNNVHKMIIFQR